MGEGHFSILAFWVGGVRRRWLLETLYCCVNDGVTSGNLSFTKGAIVFRDFTRFQSVFDIGLGTSYDGIAVMD